MTDVHLHDRYFSRTSNSANSTRRDLFLHDTLIFVRNYFLVFYYAMNDNLLWISRAIFSIVVQIINIDEPLFEENQETKWIIK